jgi:hypothetical protein
VSRPAADWSLSTPPEIVVVPVNVLLPESTQVPTPIF